MKVLKSLLKSATLAMALIIGEGLPSAQADDGRMYDICHTAVAAQALAQDEYNVELGSTDLHLIQSNRDVLSADGLCEVAELTVPKKHVEHYRLDLTDGMGFVVIEVWHDNMRQYAVINELIENESAALVQAKIAD